MSDPNKPHKPPEQSTINYLLAEHKYFADSFWKSEEMGEKRLSFFITLVAAVITVLVTLHEKSTLPWRSRFLVTLFALLALLAVGILVQVRMKHRNKVSDGYKHRMDIVRNQFKAFDPEALEGYEPFAENPEKVPEIKHQRSLGRLENISIALNGIIAVAIIVYCLTAWLR